MLVKDVAGLLVWFGLVRSGSERFGRSRRFHHVIPNSPDDVVVFTTSSQALRTTSPFSPRHPKQSGRRRRFHHVIPSSPDDVVIFTTSSQAPDDVAIFTTSSQTVRTTSPFSPRHPRRSGRRRRFHHVIPATFLSAPDHPF